MVMWAINRFLTKLRHPPKFRFYSLISIMIPPALWGFVYASIPFWVLVGFCWIWFYTLASPNPSTNPNSLNFETITPLWGTGNTWSSDATETAKRGRFGIAMLWIAMFGMYETAKLYIPSNLNAHWDDDITKESAEAFDQVCASTLRVLSPLPALSPSALVSFHHLVLFPVV